MRTIWLIVLLILISGVARAADGVNKYVAVIPVSTRDYDAEVVGPIARLLSEMLSGGIAEFNREQQSKHSNMRFRNRGILQPVNNDRQSIQEFYDFQKTAQANELSRRLEEKKIDAYIWLQLDMQALEFCIKSKQTKSCKSVAELALFAHGAYNKITMPAELDFSKETMFFSKSSLESLKHGIARLLDANFALPAGK